MKIVHIKINIYFKWDDIKLDLYFKKYGLLNFVTSKTFFNFKHKFCCFIEKYVQSEIFYLLCLNAFSKKNRI